MPEFEAPMDGWLTIRVDGARVTRVEALAGEVIEVNMEAFDDD